MFCTQCGASSAEGARFCRTCGATLHTDSPTAPAPATTPASTVAEVGTVGPASSAYVGSAPGYAAGGVLPSNLGMTSASAAMSAPAAPVVYAGFWLRFVALFIDGVLLGIGGVILGVVIGIATQAQATAIATIVTLIYVVIAILYFPVMESSARQATWGKKAMGIIVTDYNGNRIGFGRAFGRFLSKIVSQLIFYIGYLMAAFTERKQALHDIMAGTLVVKGTPSER